MNAWDVVIGTCVVLAVAWALWSIRRARRAGGCASCPFAGECAKRDAGGCEVRHG